MKKRIVIIGAGFCGLSCAAELSRHGDFDITILEQSPNVGGLGGGICTEQGTFDFGSHRLHSNLHETAQHLLDELPVVLEKRIRRGKLMLSGSYTSYPPSLLNLAWCLGAAKMSQACVSFFLQRSYSGNKSPQTYETTMRRKVGNTFFDTFFGPYARKLWGMDPSSISFTAAGRWTENGTVSRSIDSFLPSRRLQQKNEYIYPESGFRHLAEALADMAVSRGVCIRTSCAVQTIQSVQGRCFQCNIQEKGSGKSFGANWVVNTAPIDEQLAMVRPGTDTADELSRSIKWRGLRLLYITTGKPVDYDGPESLYFPEMAYPFGRISFPARFSSNMGSKRGESICIEIICSCGDAVWQADDQTLVSMIYPAMRQVGICAKSDILDVFTVRFPRVYPLYSIGWEQVMHSAIELLTAHENYLPAGKMGLFLHCNIDHAMHNGILAARHITAGEGTEKWNACVSELQNVSVRN